MRREKRGYRLFSSSSLSAIRVVSPAYLRLLIFLPAILIPACASSSPVFLLMSSTLGIYFIHSIDSVYMSVPISQIIPHSFPLLVSLRLFSTSVSLFLCYRWDHLHHYFQIPHIYVNIQYLFLWLHSVWQPLLSSLAPVRDDGDNVEVTRTLQAGLILTQQPVYVR